MGLTDRDYMQARELIEGRPSFFGRLWMFVEAHAKLITFLLTLLIVVALLFIVNTYWQKSLIKKAADDVYAATDIETLKKMREKYKETNLMPIIVYRLANMEHEKGMLQEAKADYEEFLGKYRDNLLLFDEVNKAYGTLKKNMEWMETQKDLQLKSLMLSSAPALEPPERDPRGTVLPVKERNPLLKMKTAKGEIIVELFEDELPNTVANFIKLAEGEKSFNESTLKLVNKDERAQFGPAKSRPAYSLKVEKSGWEPNEGVLVMNVEKADVVSASDFQILFKAVPELKGGPIFGRVNSGMAVLKEMKEGETIKEIEIVRKRKHLYEPQIVKDSDSPPHEKEK